jgi:hypothetical protein
MNHLSQYMNQQVMLELSGRMRFTGVLVDYGLDIVVVYNGSEFLYIPLMQLHYMKLSTSQDPILGTPQNAPIENDTEKTSLRRMLTNAKGLFLKLYVIGNQTIHGYMLNVLNDYFVFYSPVYKTMYISLHHLKWLTPYMTNVTPYSLNNQQIPVFPANLAVPRTFEEQLKKLEGNIVVFDIGDHPSKTGLLRKVANSMVVLVTGEGEEYCWNLQHLKSVHVP